MLRLVIVDDERIIRETINDIIDWKGLGINVVGLCKNGIEAYDTILDEYPDIVMTDIKMPGLSGLELIKRLSETDRSIEYIILSGYGEFEYAKEAMKYGVKHYLLKPCNEHQIMEVINTVKEDCYRRKALHDLQQERQLLMVNMRKTIIRNILIEGLSNEADLPSLLRQYGMYLDFRHTGYQVAYFHFLDTENLEGFLEKIYAYMAQHSPGLPVYPIYVQQTLLFFFESFDVSYADMDSFFSNASASPAGDGIKYVRQGFENLELLLEETLGRLRRYEVVNLIQGTRINPVYNYRFLIDRIGTLSRQIHEASGDLRQQLINELDEQLLSVNDVSFLKTLVSNLLLKNPHRQLTPVLTSEILLELNDSTEAGDVLHLFNLHQKEIFGASDGLEHKYKDFIEKIISYVEENLSNPSLSLKWIAENHLFMNVDYVSKQFIKETGDKFSAFLTNTRIRKAKELLLDCGIEKIYIVAEAVGCGNNPQYFSQVFKRNTGMTPTEYIKKMNGGN
ncbi:response regulator [Anaerotalea alkaliphila]|uniref:Stage 0 sporulation protein A homolog n=1 Tax=Anaerotalea alkaliphila TaxID=2662126 RepID=A0A7X5KLQ0_9FIRM|nr:response regulator [Anaerotalea alkaliphila]NDL67066.1 response regulator [Anaerotalea alkaliphila]